MTEVIKLTRLVGPTIVGVHTRTYTTPTRNTPPSSSTQTPLCPWKKSWFLPPKKISQQRWEEGLALKNKTHAQKNPSLLPTTHTPAGFALLSPVRRPEAVRTRLDPAPFGPLSVTTRQTQINFRVGRGRKKKAERMHWPLFH